MIRAVAVDDEPKSIDVLGKLVRKCCPGLEIVATADCVTSALRVIEDHRPDLVFLDVELGESDGFHLLERLPRVDFEVIFVTGHDEYAVRAFRFSAVDYLLKPVDPEELTAAIDKVERKLDRGLQREKLDALLENLAAPDDKHRKKIALPTTDGLRFVKVSDIARCQAEEHYTHIYLKNKERILVSKILKEYEDLLADLGFFRVHHSHLINLDLIDQYVRTGGDHVVMADGSKVPISKRKKEGFLQRVAEKLE